MRPVERGSIPTRADGTPKTVSDYKNWRIDLIARLGNYCSFCEMTLNDSPQVEHVIAQDIDDTKALEWTNLLLACGACNRSKSNKPCPKTTHYLPTLNTIPFCHSDYPKQPIPDNKMNQPVLSL